MFILSFFLIHRFLILNTVHLWTGWLYLFVYHEPCVWR